ncbi:MAG: hypothetical protein V2I48_04710 [Xanthomonadales bacterium]|jgi:hypothetical protein|nr:hypothetical protein [Xanthomonadales bacterium]
MKISYKTAGYTLFLSLLIGNPSLQADSAEVDFSCMREMVRPIIQVTDRHQEYDVVIRNQCPGPVFWSMCIERMDPWTHKVLENHLPAGYIEAEKKSRVNLQMKSTPNAAGDVNRSQEFYVNLAYSIEGPTDAPCVASQCEAKKTALRKQLRSNEVNWQKARAALQARAETACPDNGWNSADLKKCRQDVIGAASEDMSVYALADEDLRQKLAEIDPQKCTVYGGKDLDLKNSR